MERKETIFFFEHIPFLQPCINLEPTLYQGRLPSPSLGSRKSAHANGMVENFKPLNVFELMGLNGAGNRDMYSAFSLMTLFIHKKVLGLSLSMS
jgi:hypothetical protein